MARIVCALDEPRRAVPVASVAKLLGEALGLPLTLVTVVPRPFVPGASAAPRGVERLLGQTRDEAGELLAWTLREADLPQTTALRVEVGDAADRLVETARSEEAALLVAGCRCRGRLASVVLGSVSAALIARSPCPVVVVPVGAASQVADAAVAGSS
jgi:nucleotide-binding universal stress UspA family protein